MNETQNHDISKSFREKKSSKFLDPCQKESLNSMECLDRNNYDKGKCKDLFILYRECKKKWVSFYIPYICLIFFHIKFIFFLTVGKTSRIAKKRVT